MNLQLIFYKFLRNTFSKHIDNATFLLDNGNFRCMNYLSMTVDFNAFKHMVKRCKEKRADTLYLYTSNEADGRPAPVSFYQNNLIGGGVNRTTVKEWQKRLLYAISEKMYITTFLFADDSPRIARTSLGTKISYVDDTINFFNDYIDRYVVGLEANESGSIGDLNQVRAIAQKLRSSGKKVGLHLTPGKYDWSKIPEIDIHFHQYGFGKTVYAVGMDTRSVAAAVGKPVIAAEYDLSSNRPELGDAAMRAGAVGTGNGRTV